MDEEILEICKNINHIAFIMDGNRRWAVSNGKNRLEGHIYGEKALKEILKLQEPLNIKNFTFFALSKDNKKKRGEEEYNSLMNLFNKYFDSFNEDLKKRGKYKFRVNVIGDYKELRKDAVEKLDKIIKDTENNNEFNINFCINYDGQSEIVEGVKNLFHKIALDEFNIEDFNENEFKKFLWTKDIPSPEIIVRTGNLPRLSGFLLWDSHYSEIFFSEKMWPDFNKEDLFYVIKWFSKIKRKFGR